MLSRARAKGLPVVRGDACHLPFGTASADAMMIVSVLHLVPDWLCALGEARRVLRPGGVLDLMVYAREHLPVHWVLSYFPRSQTWVWPEHQTLSELRTALPGCEVIPFEFTDLADASLSALCRWPDLFLDPAYRARTSYFERLARHDPAELEIGLARLADDLRRGRRPDLEVAPLRRQVGDGAVIAWRQPPPARTV
jgi:SAM-dependent methyltransferase